MPNNPENPALTNEQANTTNDWESVSNPDLQSSDSNQEGNPNAQAEQQPTVDRKEEQENSIRTKVIDAILPDGTQFHGTTEQYNEAVKEYLDNIS